MIRLLSYFSLTCCFMLNSALASADIKMVKSCMTVTAQAAMYRCKVAMARAFIPEKTNV